MHKTSKTMNSQYSLVLSSMQPTLLLGHFKLLMISLLSSDNNLA